MALGNISLRYMRARAYVNTRWCYQTYVAFWFRLVFCFPDLNMEINFFLSFTFSLFFFPFSSLRKWEETSYGLCLCLHTKIFISLYKLIPICILNRTFFTEKMHFYAHYMSFEPVLQMCGTGFNANEEHTSLVSALSFLIVLLVLLMSLIISSNSVIIEWTMRRKMCDCRKVSWHFILACDSGAMTCWLLKMT